MANLVPRPGPRIRCDRRTGGWGGTFLVAVALVWLASTAGAAPYDGSVQLRGSTLASTTGTPNCASCHGANGQGGRNANGIAGPGIRGASSSDVFAAVVDGYGGMPAIPDLITGQINAITGFLH